MDQREETEQLCGKLDDLMEEDRSSSEEGLRVSEKTCKAGADQTGGKLTLTVDERPTCGEGDTREEKKASFLISEGESDEEEEQDAQSMVINVSGDGDHCRW